MEAPFVVAVDGPAASGKGTLAKRLAVHFGLAHLDTGLLYRAVGAKALENDADLDNPEAAAQIANTLDLTHLDAEFLAQHFVGEAASRVAVHPPVRAALLEAQRAFAATQPGAVLDGRDIGTVVCPNADAKLFVTASLEARTDRRFAQAVEVEPATQREAIMADLKRRDERDSGRKDAPMVQADDALLLDTTNMSIDAAFEEARAYVASRQD